MIVIGTTLAAFVMDQECTWKAWTYNAEAIRASHPAGVHYFAAIQTDNRGLEPFTPLLDRLKELGGSYWTYSFDDGRTVIKDWSRNRHVNVGQNIIREYCQNERHDCTHWLYLATDCEPPPDILPKLLEVNHPVTAPYIPVYNCPKQNGRYRGPAIPGYPFEVREPSFSSSALLIARSVFRRIHFRWSGDGKVVGEPLPGIGDDDCFKWDVEEFLKIAVRVRMDCVVKHHPEKPDGQWPSLEDRGHSDLRVYR